MSESKEIVVDKVQQFNLLQDKLQDIKVSLYNIKRVKDSLNVTGSGRTMELEFDVTKEGTHHKSSETLPELFVLPMLNAIDKFIKDQERTATILKTSMYEMLR